MFIISSVPSEAIAVGDMPLQSGFCKLPLDPEAAEQSLCSNEVRKQCYM